MNVSCPSCGKQLKLSDKFVESLKSLKPGQKARVKCSQCSEPFALDTGLLKTADQSPVRKDVAPKARRTSVKPPEPPDVSWLEEGIFEDQEVVEEIPLALILIPESAGRAEVVKAVEALGYRVEIADNSLAAIDKMEFVNYSGVILHNEFEPEGIEGGPFHKSMCGMSMSKRRYIFYALIGKDFRTLYDLEALAYSANIVVNEKDVGRFGIILRKAIPDYEALFGPLMEELRVLGK